MVQWHAVTGTVVPGYPGYQGYRDAPTRLCIPGYGDVPGRTYHQKWQQQRAVILRASRWWVPHTNTNSSIPCVHHAPILNSIAKGAWGTSLIQLLCGFYWMNHRIPPVCVYNSWYDLPGYNVATDGIGKWSRVVTNQPMP
eukprot:707837-Rhodomonas_salina.1